MSLFLRKHEEVIPPAGLPKIKSVRAYVTRANEYGASDVHDTADTHWIMGMTDASGGWDHVTTHPPITNPMSRFGKYAGSRKSWGVANVPSVLVEVEQEDGLVGVGMSTGGEAACFIIEHHLAMFVEGQNVRNISHMWEQVAPPRTASLRCRSPFWSGRCSARRSTTRARGWPCTPSRRWTSRCGTCSAR